MGADSVRIAAAIYRRESGVDIRDAVEVTTGGKEIGYKTIEGAYGPKGRVGFRVVDAPLDAVD